ncbi:MAG: hypothetical protein IK062_07725 [Selenomonadaceae bacterium]|nr:hypothetical protein [Selenomonadaceae bacterium]
MVKKIFSVSILLIGIIFGSVVSAECPKYLDAEKNYILYADLGIHGAGLYLDRHTVGIAEEDNDKYIILVDTVDVPDADKGKTRISNRFSNRYSFDMKEMKAYRYENFDDKWIEIDWKITDKEDPKFTYDAKIAEAAFYLAVKAKFFGTLDKVIFNDDFYKSLD